MQQEIQIKLHMSVSINSKYDEKELVEIVLRNVGFKNNCTYLHKLEFIEERGIYSDGELSDWVTVVENKDVLGAGFFRDSKVVDGYIEVAKQKAYRDRDNRKLFKDRND